MALKLFHRWSLANQSDELIRLNRGLLVSAEQTRNASRILVMQSRIERVQRALSDRRPLGWALDMAAWAARTERAWSHRAEFRAGAGYSAGAQITPPSGRLA
jgi:hypothetical protein